MLEKSCCRMLRSPFADFPASYKLKLDQAKRLCGQTKIKNQLEPIVEPFF